MSDREKKGYKGRERRVDRVSVTVRMEWLKERVRRRIEEPGKNRTIAERGKGE